MTDEIKSALETALRVLTDRAAETDTASPEGHEVREAIATIEAMLDGSIDL